MDRFGELLNWIDDLLDNGMNNREIHYLRGMALKNMAEPEKALTELKIAEEMAGSDDEPYIAMAEIFAEMGNETDALACLTRPELGARALGIRGDIELRFGHYANAIESYKKCLKEDPRKQSAWYGRGMAHLGIGEPDKAIKCFDTAIGMDPDYVWAWAGKARAYRAMGDEKRARQVEEIVMELDGDFEL